MMLANPGSMTLANDRNILQRTSGGTLGWLAQSNFLYFTDGARAIVSTPDGPDDYPIKGTAGAWIHDGSSKDFLPFRMPVSTSSGAALHERVDLAVPGVGPTIA